MRERKRETTRISVISITRATFYADSTLIHRKNNYYRGNGWRWRGAKSWEENAISRCEEGAFIGSRRDPLPVVVVIRDEFRYLLDAIHCLVIHAFPPEIYPASFFFPRVYFPLYTYISIYQCQLGLSPLSPPSGTHLSSRRCYCVTTGIQRVSRCLYRAVPRGIPGKRDYFSQFAKQMLPLCSAPAVAGVCFPRTLPLFFFSSDLLSLIEPSSRRVDQDFFFPFFFSFFPSSFHLCTRRRSRHRRRRRARARVYSRIYTPAFPDRVARHPTVSR